MPSIALPHAVMFDMDGLIFDTEALYCRALEALAAEQGLARFDRAVVRSFVGLSWDETRGRLAGLLGSAAAAERLIGDWLARYDDLAEQGDLLKPGVLELLDTLDRLAIPRAIATGSYRVVAERHLNTHGFGKRFDALVAKEDCASGKPSPEPFLTAAQLLGVAPATCWALEDSLHGVASAHAAGMTTIMIPDLVAPDAEARRRCYRIGASLADVVALLTD